jgi:hypothetical protein
MATALNIGSHPINTETMNDKLRSDIRYHLAMEPLLQHVCKRLHLPKEALEELLKDAIQALTPEKKSRFSFTKKKKTNAAYFAFRRLVRTHLNILLTRSQLTNFKQTLEEKIAGQLEVASIEEKYPTALDPRSLPPKKAITALELLLQQTNAQLDRLERTEREEQQTVKTWLDSIESALDTFLNNTKSNNQLTLADIVTEPQKHLLLRLISGVTPPSMLAAVPEKKSPEAAFMAEIERLSKRG